MALETGTYISDLVATNPTSTDPKSEGDNHLRMIKSTVKATFPNVTGAVTKTHTQLNNTLDKTGDTMTGPLAQAAGTAALPSYTFSGDTNTGVFSPGADRIGIAVGGAQAIEVNASGNVGFGGTPAAWRAGGKVAQFGNYASISEDQNSAGAVIGGNVYESAAGVYRYTASLAASRYEAGLGTHKWWVASSGATGNVVSFTQALAIDASANVLVTGSGGLGYGTGSGGTVGQVTNRDTGVALNKPSGQITLVSGTTTAGTFNSFTLTNSSIAATDGVEVCFASGATANSYGLLVTAIAAGSCRIQIHNIAAVAVAEAPVIQFRVIKAATS